MLRITNMLIVLHLAILMSFIGVGNIIAYDINFAFVQHVMMMDTTFLHPVLMSHAIVADGMHHLAYNSIIFVECITAGILWAAGLGGLWFSKNNEKYRKCQSYLLLGLTLGVLLMGVAFLSIASEWFASWQSQAWSGQRTAGMYLMDFLLVYLIIAVDYKKLGDK